MQAYGCIFVVDAAALDRFNEARVLLSGIFQDEKMRGKPVLIFANKQDSGGAITGDLLRQELCLTGFLEGNAQLIHVVCVNVCGSYLWE